MYLNKIKVKNLNTNYNVVIGKNILNILPREIRNLCPKTKK